MELIAYTRISSDGQMDGYGLDSQVLSIRAWADSSRHEVRGVVSDVGVSGATNALDRPGLSEVLQALTVGEADGLVVARLDRLAPALTVQEATLAIIWRSGKDVFTADSGKVLADDPDDPMRTALRQVIGVFAELDRRMVVKRLRDGRVAKAASGRKAVGVYPYGYAGIGKGRTRDAAPLLVEQVVVAEVLKARTCGMTYRQIAGTLDASPHRPRKAQQWSPMTVRGIVLREAARATG